MKDVINYAAITSHPLYAREIRYLETSGRKKASVLWILCIIPIFWIPLIIYALLKIPQATKLQNERQTSLQNFARDNGYAYMAPAQGRSTDDTDDDFCGTLPFLASSKRLSQKMTGSLQGFGFEYVSGLIHSVKAGSPRADGSATTRTTNTQFINLLRVALPVELPKLYIDAKRNNIAGYELKPSSLAGVQEYRLEGDFSDIYKVYAEPNDQINVLSILTPEVMLALPRTAHYDVWLDGRSLTIYATATDIEYFVGIPVIFEIAYSVVREIDLIQHSSLARQNEAGV